MGGLELGVHGSASEALYCQTKETETDRRDLNIQTYREALYLLDNFTNVDVAHKLK